MNIFRALLIALPISMVCQHLGVPDDTTMLCVSMIFAGGLAGMKSEWNQ